MDTWDRPEGLTGAHGGRRRSPEGEIWRIVQKRYCRKAWIGDSPRYSMGGKSVTVTRGSCRRELE